MRTPTKLWIGIIILIFLSPLGIIIPAYFKASAAWGEWGPDEIRGLVGYVPRGLERLAEFWKSLLPDYTIRGLKSETIGYIISAVVGVLIVALVCFGLAKLLIKKDR